MSRIARGMLIVVGGALLGAERECLNSMEVLESGGGFRLLDQRLNQPRRSPAIYSTSAGEFVVVGGCNGSEHLKDAEKFCNANPVSDHLTDLPYGFSCAAYCQVKDGSCYVFGGYNEQGCLNQVVRFHGRELAEQIPLMTRLKNSVAVPVPDNNQILLFGGWDGKRTMDSVFSYRTDGSQEFYSRLPYPTEGHSAVTYKNQVYIVAGYDGVSVIDTIIRYDISDKNSEVLTTKLSRARENHVALLVDDEEDHPYLLVIGGWDGKQALKSCEKFRIEDQEPWLKRVDCNLELNEPRNRPAAIVV